MEERPSVYAGRSDAKKSIIAARSFGFKIVHVISKLFASRYKYKKLRLNKSKCCQCFYYNSLYYKSTQI